MEYHRKFNTILIKKYDEEDSCAKQHSHDSNPPNDFRRPYDNTLLAQIICHFPFFFSHDKRYDPSKYDRNGNGSQYPSQETFVHKATS